MLWIGALFLPQDGLQEAPTTGPCRVVDQLDTAQTVDLERGYKGKRYCGPGAAPQISDLSRGSREATDFALPKPPCSLKYTNVELPMILRRH